MSDDNFGYISTRRAYVLYGLRDLFVESLTRASEVKRRTQMFLKIKTLNSRQLDERLVKRKRRAKG
jgi:hypothetical protein